MRHVAYGGTVAYGKRLAVEVNRSSDNLQPSMATAMQLVFDFLAGRKRGKIDSGILVDQQ